MRIAGCIIAGGRSQRMGQDKATIMLAGKTLLTHAVERFSPQVEVLAINANSKVVYENGPIVADSIPDFAGPLAGILAALEWAQALTPPVNALVTVPVDAPFFPADLVVRLKNQDINQITTTKCDGQLHPLFTLWPLDVTALLRQWLETPQNRSVKHFIAEQKHQIVEFACVGELDPFMNLNTPQDLERAQDYLKNQ
jgi:molybdopterin-guanine dinucleotide biosynthesis protein A